MIITEEKRDVQSNGNFESKGFSIRANSKAFGILTDKIYTHKVAAVIREISCNAYDSHIAAKNDAPFKVHLPTTLESWFSVRDYGTGISHEQMMTLYTEFFVSTKNHSNDFVGALGIGRVSPFTIVDNFSLTSFYNGIVRNYSCYKSETGEPTLSFLSESPTDQPNGVEVRVKVGSNMIYEFKSEAIKVFTYFNQTPEINNQDVVAEIDRRRNLYVIKEDGLFAFTTGYGSIKAVMGNVAYDIPSSCLIDGLRSLDGVVYFNIGELDFDPGRESLSLNERTREAINERFLTIKDSLTRYIEKRVEDQPTPFKKSLEVYRLSRGAFSNIVTRRITDLGELPATKESFKVYGRDRGCRTYTANNYPHSKNTLVYLYKKGYDYRIKAFVKDRVNEVENLCVVTQEQADEMLIDPEYILDLDTIPKVTRVSNTIYNREMASIFEWNGQSSYKMHQNWDAISIDIKDPEEKVYVELNNWKITNSPSYLENQYELKAVKTAFLKYADFPVVYGVKTAVIKKKGFQQGNWIKLEDYLARESAKRNIRVFTYSGNYSEVLVAAKFLGGKFKSFSDIVAQNHENTKILENIGFTIDKDDSADIIEGELIKKYPMLKFMSGYQVTENKQLVKEYVNERDTMQA